MYEVLAPLAAGGATFIGVMLVYLSLRNQAILPHSISPLWGWLGLGMVLISLVLWFVQLRFSTALFVWIASTLVCFFVVPFFSLLCGKRSL